MSDFLPFIGILVLVGLLTWALLYVMGNPKREEDEDE
jgi:hypothetical protein